MRHRLARTRGLDALKPNSSGLPDILISKYALSWPACTDKQPEPGVEPRPPEPGGHVSSDSNTSKKSYYTLIWLLQIWWDKHLCLAMRNNYYWVKIVAQNSGSKQHTASILNANWRPCHISAQGISCLILVMTRTDFCSGMNADQINFSRLKSHKTFC